MVEEVGQGHGVLLPSVRDVRVAANPKNDRLAHISFLHGAQICIEPSSGFIPLIQSKKSNSLSELVVFRLSVPREIDRPWGDVHVHDPVDDLGLEVALVLVDHVLLASVEQLRGELVELVLVLYFEQTLIVICILIVF